MTDNVEANAGSGGATFRTDDDGTAHWPYTKIAFGADNTQTIVTSIATNPLPVALSDTDNAVLDDIAARTSDPTVYVDDADWTALTSSHALIGGIYESSPGAITDGDTGPIRLSANGAVHIHDGGNTITVDGTVTANPASGTIDTVTTVTTVTTCSTVTNLAQIGGQAIPVFGTTTYSEATSTGVLSGAVRNDTLAALADTDNEVAPLQVNASGALYVQEGTALDVSGATVTVDCNSSNITVDGLPASNLGQQAMAASLSVVPASDITDATYIGDIKFGEALPTGSNTIGAVNIAAAQTLATVTTVGTVTTLTGSGVAHDAADSGNPHKIGAKATTSVSGNTMVADNDRTDVFAGVDGVLITRNHCNLEDQVQERDSNTDGASTAFGTGLAAPGAGIRLWVTKVTFGNSSSTNLTVDLRDGAAGSVLWTTPVPANGGAIEVFDPPLKLTANTALAYDGSAAASTLYISAIGFKSKV